MTALVAAFAAGVVCTLIVSTVALAMADVRRAARREQLHKERARARDFAARWS